VKLAGPKAAPSASEQGRVSNFSKKPPMDSYEISSAFRAFRHIASRINIMSGEARPQAHLFGGTTIGVSEPLVVVAPSWRTARNGSRARQM
jgi:hypothetical protein